MSFALTGSTTERGFRRFTFESGDKKQPKTTVVVSAEMSLVQKYAIPLQELPLLCCRFLDSWTEGAGHTTVFTEQEMAGYATRRKAAKEQLALQKRAPVRRFKVASAGAAPGAGH